MTASALSAAFSSGFFSSHAKSEMPAAAIRTTSVGEKRSSAARRTDDKTGKPDGDAYNAYGRDHPAKSEHDHAHQQLDGESVRISRDGRPKR